MSTQRRKLGLVLSAMAMGLLVVAIALMNRVPDFADGLLFGTAIGLGVLSVAILARNKKAKVID